MANGNIFSYSVKTIFMRFLFLITFFTAFVFNSYGQEEVNIVSKLKSLTEKGDYVILEVRLNNEDEFRTIEGSSSSLARIAIYTGNNQGTEVVSKGFEGVNSIVTILNKLKKHKWDIVDVYSLKGESLIITHYILERKK